MTRGRNLNSQHPKSLIVQAILQSKEDLFRQILAVLDLYRRVLTVSLGHCRLLLGHETSGLLQDDNYRHSLYLLEILLLGLVRRNMTATHH